MKALEFYSGIGGLHYALDQVRPGATVVALDINDLANFVYEHNFGTKPVQTNISTVTAKQLDKWAAEVWLMSPPCQPYTRRGLKKQSADARATSFLGILELIPKLEHPPKYLLVENVVGFETSDTRQELAVTLLGAGYELQEFIVTPSQLGIPYSRPRYFALAKRGDGFLLPTPPEGQGPLRQPPSQLLAAQLSTRQPLEQSIQEGQQQQQLQQQHHNGTQSAAAESSGHMCSSAGTAGERQASAQPLPATAPAAVAARVRPLGDFLVDSPAAELAGGVKVKLPNLSGLQRAGAAIGRRSGPELEQGPQSSALGAAENGKTFRAADAAAIDAAGEGHEVQPREQAQQAAMEAGQLGDAWEAFRVPEDVVRKHGRCFDLVSALSTTCNCFTKTYGQYVKGSGSLIATSNLHILRELEEEEEEQLAAGTSEQREAGGSVAAELAEGVSRAALVGAPEGDVGAPLDIQDAEVNTMAGTGGRAGPTQGQHAEQRQGRTWPSVLEEGQQASQQATPPSTNASAALFDSLQLLGLRYFTPREIANLHSFPADFSFPPSVTLRQRYALLGNSLSVAVVADLLAYLFLEH